MINDRPAPFAFRVKPRQLVRSVEATVDLDTPTVRSHATAGNVPGTMAPLLAPPPVKVSGFWVVIQELAQPLLRQFGFFHCAP
jgi:hypothetical protein